MTTVEIQGMRVSVSAYMPSNMDVWYLVLGSGTEVKSFGDETSMASAIEMFRQHGYKGCPTDKAYYLKHREKTMNVTAAIYSVATRFWVDIELQWQQLREILFPLDSLNNVLHYEMEFKNHYDQDMNTPINRMRDLIIALHEEKGKTDLYNKAVSILEKSDTIYLDFSAEMYRLEQLGEQRMFAH